MSIRSLVPADAQRSINSLDVLKPGDRIPGCQFPMPYTLCQPTVTEPGVNLSLDVPGRFMKRINEASASMIGEPSSRGLSEDERQVADLMAENRRLREQVSGITRSNERLASALKAEYRRSSPSIVSAYLKATLSSVWPAPLPTRLSDSWEHLPDPSIDGVVPPVPVKERALANAFAARRVDPRRLGG